MHSQTIREPEKIRRIQENLLAAGERRLLDRLCRRAPRWMTPDQLTTVGLLGAALVFAGYVASNLDKGWLWLCVAGYLVHWFGDSMDGSLARFRQIERPRYGYFLDHSCDGVATLAILAGIGASPYVRLDVALIAACGYFLLSIHAYVAARVVGEMRLSYLAAGPTELRLVLIALTLAMLLFGDGARAGAERVTGFDWFVGGAGVVLVALFVAQTMRTARELAAAEPPPRPRR